MLKLPGTEQIDKSKNSHKKINHWKQFSITMADDDPWAEDAWDAAEEEEKKLTPPSPTSKQELMLPDRKEDDPWGGDLDENNMSESVKEADNMWGADGDDVENRAAAAEAEVAATLKTEAAATMETEVAAAAEEENPWGMIEEKEETPPASINDEIVLSSEDQAVADAKQKEEEIKAQQEEMKVQEASATKIQARARGRKERQDMKEQQEGAAKIQAKFRGNYGRKKVAIAREENNAASKIQARARGRTARKEKNEQDMAAKKIQSRIRGKQSRDAKEKAEKDAAALKIQAVQRSRKARAAKAREKAAIAKIQAMERGRQTRKNMPSLIDAEAVGIDTTQDVDEQLGFFQSSGLVRNYKNPYASTMVADTGMQTQLLPPDAPPKTPPFVIQMEDVLATYQKGIQALHKAYTSKNGMNRTGDLN